MSTPKDPFDDPFYLPPEDEPPLGPIEPCPPSTTKPFGQPNKVPYGAGKALRDGTTVAEAQREAARLKREAIQKRAIEKAQREKQLAESPWLPPDPTRLAPPGPLDDGSKQERVAPPPQGVPGDSILSTVAIPLTHLDRLHNYHQLDERVGEGVDIRPVELQIGLLSRYVMLDALWRSEGWSKKERFDAAAKAISVIEGTKSTIWTNDVGDKKGWSEERVQKETLDATHRLAALMAKLNKKGPEAAFDAAAQEVALDAPRRDDEGGEN